MKIDLKELGEGQYVEIRDPKRLKWKEQKAITSALTDDSLAAQLDVAERITIALVKEGYVLDDDNKPIAFPLTVDNVGNVPAAVIEAVSKAFAESKKAVTEKN